MFSREPRRNFYFLPPAATRGGRLATRATENTYRGHGHTQHFASPGDSHIHKEEEKTSRSAHHPSRPTCDPSSPTSEQSNTHQRDTGGGEVCVCVLCSALLFLLSFSGLFLFFTCTCACTCTCMEGPMAWMRGESACSSARAPADSRLLRVLEGARRPT